MRIAQAVGAMRRTGWTQGQGWFRRHAPLGRAGRAVFEVAVHGHLTAYVDLHVPPRLHDAGARALRPLGYWPYRSRSKVLHCSRPLTGVVDPDREYRRIVEALEELRPSDRRPALSSRKVLRPQPVAAVRRALGRLLAWAPGAWARGWEMGFGVHPNRWTRKGVRAWPMLHWSEGELSLYVEIAAAGADRPSFADRVAAELAESGYRGEWFALPWKIWMGMFRRRFVDPGKAVAEGRRLERSLVPGLELALRTGYKRR